MKVLPDKQKVLADIGVLVGAGKLSRRELEQAYTNHAANDGRSSDSRPSNVATALYAVGTVIVCVGICLLIAQNWELLNTPVRILLTLGLGLGLFMAAWYRARGQADVNQDLLATSLFTIAAVATSVGVGVVVEETVGEVSDPAHITSIAILLFGLFTIAYLRVVRSLVLVFAAVIMTIVVYYAGIEWGTQDIIKTDWFYPLISVFAGMLLIGYGFAFAKRALVSRLSDVLYYTGAVLTLGAAFWLSFSWNPSGNGSSLGYDILYPFFLAAGVALSVWVRSRAVLVATAMFLTFYVIKLSVVYFADFLGGSLALLLAGALVIAMAYGTTRFAKRFIAN